MHAALDLGLNGEKKLQGGIAMSLEAFTWPISCGGAILILYSLTAYPKIIKSLGCINLARIGLLAAIPCALLVPTSSLLSPYALQQVSPTVQCLATVNDSWYALLSTLHFLFMASIARPASESISELVTKKDASNFQTSRMSLISCSRTNGWREKYKELPLIYFSYDTTLGAVLNL